MKMRKRKQLILDTASSYEELLNIVLIEFGPKFIGFLLKCVKKLAQSKQFIKDLIDENFTLDDIRYSLIHNEYPKHIYCPICGVEIHVFNGSYLKTCNSKLCRYKFSKQVIELTNLQKYGVKCVFQNKDIYEKGKQTRIKTYGSANNYAKQLETLINEYGVNCMWNVPSVKEKSKLTMIKNLGYEYALSSPKIHQKSKQTKLERYGDENYRNIEKIKKTKLERYGDENYCNTEKAKLTFIKHYGVDNNMKSKEGLEEYKNSIKEKYGTNFFIETQCFKDKCIDTCIEKYGVKHHMQNYDILKKCRKKYSYNNMTFDSSWELAFWIYCIDNNIKIQRCKISFEYYDIKGILHQYFPDFIINDNEYIEIKGDDQFNKDGKLIDKLDPSKDYIAEAKYNCIIKNNVKLITGKDIKIYLDYIKQHYGNKYLKLFKNN